MAQFLNLKMHLNKSVKFLMNNVLNLDFDNNTIK
jgi:hypothetical protein